MKRFILILLAQFIVFFGTSQDLSGRRIKTFTVTSDTIVIDTLSIVNGSVSISDTKGVSIDTAYYRVDYGLSLLLLMRDSASVFTSGDTFQLRYRVLPFSFSKSIQHKEISKLNTNETGLINPFLFQPQEFKPELFSFGGLNKSGSISRGIAFGNNQDVVLNSSLNLRLSGKLSDNLDVMAAISDENIPLQPEGNTQQLQDFDKVFIQVTGKSASMVAGDFELKRPDSYFMNLNKKAQGGYFTYRIDSGAKNSIFRSSSMRTGAGAAISKGKFARNLIQGLEGNQGPYRLRGNNNESYIIILSGTERVYVNGDLLQRGQEYDYVIEYNSAEITFTAHKMITKDSRITVEFEYSDKNYVRSLYYLNHEQEINRLKIKFNFFSEQDNSNQPLLQDLSDENKKLLMQIGDNLDSAFVLTADSVAYNPDEILYRKTDSLVSSVVYYGIFVQSSDPTTAYFRPGFTYVGTSKGNYRIKNSAANGRVYEWVTPLMGVPQGDYEPVTRLITPRLQQLYTLGADYALSINNKISVEAALSKNDINRFSGKDKGNDDGYAIRFNYSGARPLNADKKDGWNLVTGLSYEQTEKTFSTQDRYRTIEFDRDWNTGGSTYTGNEYIGGTSVGIKKNNTGMAGYQLRTYVKSDQYQGILNSGQASFTWKGFRITSDGNYLKTKSINTETGFLRHKADLSKKIRGMSVGVKEESERNQLLVSGKDSLALGSFMFQELQAYFSAGDSSKNKVRIDATQRNDQAASGNIFRKSAQARSAGISTQLYKNPKTRFSSYTTYRTLEIKDSLLTSQLPVSSLLNRIEYDLVLFRGLLTSSTFHETGTGQEQKKQFTYLEVPAGKGLYAWKDYNNNAVKELNEFETAVFSDEAQYVKIFTPTNEYIKTYTGQFSQLFYLQPAAAIKKQTGIGKFISRFSDQFLVRMDRKTAKEELWSTINPLHYSLTDTGLISINSSIRNIFYFNRSASAWGADVTWQDTRGKNLLTNGFESRELKEKGINLRWNTAQSFTTLLTVKSVLKKNTLEYSPLNNYRIEQRSGGPRISWQPGTVFRTTLQFEYSEKTNSPFSGGEHSILRKSTVEIRYTAVTKGNITATFNYISISYNAVENSPVAYEMLEGFKKGQNYTWNVLFQRNLSGNMQMGISYEGRKTEAATAVHTGNVQIRAYF